MNLEECFSLIVPNESLSDAELKDMWERYDAAQKALDLFIQGKISFPDYLDIAEEAEIEIDNYLDDIEFNLESRSLI